MSFVFVKMVLGRSNGLQSIAMVLACYPISLCFSWPFMLSWKHCLLIELNSPSRRSSFSLSIYSNSYHSWTGCSMLTERNSWLSCCARLWVTDDNGTLPINHMMIRKENKARLVTIWQQKLSKAWYRIRRWWVWGCWRYWESMWASFLHRLQNSQAFILRSVVRLLRRATGVRPISRYATLRIVWTSKISPMSQRQKELMSYLHHSLSSYCSVEQPHPWIYQVELFCRCPSL